MGKYDQNSSNHRTHCHPFEFKDQQIQVKDLVDDNHEMDDINFDWARITGEWANMTTPVVDDNHEAGDIKFLIG